jgi:predicted PurR-regulated permease PerM
VNIADAEPRVHKVPGEDRGAPRRDGAGRFLLLLAALVIVIAGLRAASVIVVPFLVGTFVALLSMPLLFWLRGRGVTSLLAVAITLFADLAVLAGAGFLVTRSVNELVGQLPTYEERFDQLTDQVVDWLEARQLPVRAWMGVEEEAEPPEVRGVVRVDEPIVDSTEEQVGDGWWLNLFDVDALVGVANRTVRGVAAALSNVLVVLLIVAFILAEAATFKDKLRLAFGSSRWADRFGRMTRELRRYLAVKTVISLATGLLLGFWVALVGVDFAVFWGLVAFLLNYIPNLGSIIAAVPPFLLALVQLGPGPAALVGLGYLVVNVALGNVVEPWWMGRRLGLSTLVVFLSLVFWGWVFGPVGMFLSVPLTMALKITLENNEDFRWLAVLLGDAGQLARKRAVGRLRRHRRRVGRRRSTQGAAPGGGEATPRDASEL